MTDRDAEFQLGRQPMQEATQYASPTRLISGHLHSLRTYNSRAIDMPVILPEDVANTLDQSKSLAAPAFCPISTPPYFTGHLSTARRFLTAELS